MAIINIKVTELGPSDARQIKRMRKTIRVFGVPVLTVNKIVQDGAGKSDSLDSIQFDQ